MKKLFAILLTFAILFSTYAAYITLIDGQAEINSKKHNKIRKIAFIAGIIFGFLVIITKIDLYCKGWVMYSAGPSANVVYFASTLGTILCSIFMIFNYKNIKRTELENLSSVLEIIENI